MPPEHFATAFDGLLSGGNWRNKTPLMKKVEKAPVDPELKRRIEELIAYKGGGYNEDAVTDLIENALKILTDVKDSGDARVIQTALRELRYAFKKSPSRARSSPWARAGSLRMAKCVPST